MLRELRTSLLLLIALTLVTGVLYPLAVTGVARVAFPRQAGGSLVRSGGRVIGSALLGQAFADSGRFWGRPSATAVPFDASASAASNLGPTNPARYAAVAGRVAALRLADPGNAGPIPADLVTASGSGLDPDISPAAADYEVSRVARVRGIDPARLRALVAQYTQPRTFGILGEPRVNVLALNRALDALDRDGGSR
jgi:potassium-transporting ATPase KdpC subunit